MRKRLETLTNKQCIPVWHSNRGRDEYIKSCEEYSYVALGGLVGTGKSEIPFYADNKIMNINDRDIINIYFVNDPIIPEEVKKKIRENWLKEMAGVKE